MSAETSHSRPLEGKRILVTGGTGSLGQVLVHRLLGGEMGQPSEIIVFSRDEAKQHYMRLLQKHQRLRKAILRLGASSGKTAL